MRGYWYGQIFRTSTFFRLDGDTESGYVVRAVARITKGAKSAVGRDVELILTVGEARKLAAQLNLQADRAEAVNESAGYPIDL